MFVQGRGSIITTRNICRKRKKEKKSRNQTSSKTTYIGIWEYTTEFAITEEMDDKIPQGKKKEKKAQL